MMRSSLIDLEKGIQGLVLMSSDLEETFQCIFEGRVPSMWEKVRINLVHYLNLKFNFKFEKFFITFVTLCDFMITNVFVYFYCL